jgi:hypothetical protein
MVIGRNVPPLEQTHARSSLGTTAEKERSGPAVRAIRRA